MMNQVMAMIMAIISAWLHNCNQNVINQYKTSIEPPLVVEEVVIEPTEVYYDPSHFVVPGKIDIYVEYCDNTDAYAMQRIVDDPYKACLFDYYSGCQFIADHSDQGFVNLTSICVGDLAYWQDNTYEAIYVYDGYITYPYRQMYLNGGQEPQDVHNFWTYTCTSTSTRRLVAWQIKEE